MREELFLPPEDELLRALELDRALELLRARDDELLRARELDRALELLLRALDPLDWARARLGVLRVRLLLLLRACGCRALCELELARVLAWLEGRARLAPLDCARLRVTVEGLLRA